MAAKKKAAPKRPGTRKRRGVAIEPTELEAKDLLLSELPEPLAKLADAVRSDGGAVLAQYKEPIGGNALLLVALPLDKVAPTPFQRDVSDSHVRKLTHAMDKTKRYLDPVIVVRQNDRYLTPNGNHRMTALRELGARCIVGLLVPEVSVAYQILALNIEKAHNLRERALEVVRMYRDLAGSVDQKERDFELEFDEPALVTLGFAYEKRGRLAGGAYNSALRKVDSWVDSTLTKAVPERERRAERVLELDELVNQAVKKLQERGLKSPYLKSFVVARINPLRFIKGEPPSFDELFDTMTKRAKGFDAGKIKNEDLAQSGGVPDEEG
jgi:ParB family transcriptional regulator, chromosome partitioning protein